METFRGRGDVGLLFLLLLVTVSRGVAQGNVPAGSGGGNGSTPTPAVLFARANAAIGGRAAWASYRSLHISATIEETQGRGVRWKRELYWMKPNRFHPRYWMSCA